MLPIRTTRTLVVLSLLSALSITLEVSPDSPCGPQCIDDPTTGDLSMHNASSAFGKDMPCYDWQIIGNDATQVGQKFKKCNNCLRDSNTEYRIALERDTNWFRFNNRGMVDWCLFGRFANEKNTSLSDTFNNRPCNTNCSKLFDAADYGIKDNPESFSFCDINSSNFTADAEPCLTCLYQTPQRTILGNVLATIVDQCKQKPGQKYNFPRDQEIYDTTKINFAGSSLTSATPSPLSSVSARPEPDSNGLSKGVIAGIVLGALVGIALVLGVILFFLRRKKNSNKAMEPANGDKGNGHDEFMDNHAYGSMSQQKHTYACQPVEVAHTAQSPAELEDYRTTPRELHASPTTRHEAP